MNEHELTTPTTLPGNTWAPMFPSTSAPQRAAAGTTARRDRTPVIPGTRTAPRRERNGSRPPYDLTTTELAILEILAEGATNEQIARRRNCAIGTVKVHVGRIFRKLGVENRGSAIVVARRITAVQSALLARARLAPFRVDWIVGDMTAEQHPAGSVLFRKGDPADALYYLQEGHVRLPEVGACLGDGSVFGEIGIFADDGHRTSTAICATPVRLFRVSAERAWELYVQNPSFATHIVRLAASRIMGERTRNERAQAGEHTFPADVTP